MLVGSRYQHFDIAIAVIRDGLYSVMVQVLVARSRT